MLSVILYGRNDNHGYNYHKRLAISLNCIAEVLSFENDEILFIDYNSPQDMPTALEAIEDTLTEKAKARIKLFRVRPKNSFGKRQPLLEEAVSRNVGIRLSHPNNRWILSTNIDMIFVPVDPKKTLSQLVEKLPEGFYQLPRFEIPENLWESHFNRLAPEKSLTFLRDKALKIGLNTVVRRPGFLGYDNPGDFQLMSREAIFKLDGFNESMRQGWHLDSNLCKRMALYYGRGPRDLQESLWGYHCNHTRQASFLHTQTAPENDWKQFVENVNTPDLKEQKQCWGLQGEKIEKIELNALKKISWIEPPPSSPDLFIDQSTFNTLTYASTGILPYLADHFHHLPPQTRIVYVGYNQSLLEMIEKEAPCEVLKWSLKSDLKELDSQADLWIFDFGFDQKEFSSPVNPKHEMYPKLRRSLKEMMTVFLQIVEWEKKRDKKKKLIGINVLYTDFRALFHRHLSLRKTTFVMGISFGYVKRKANSWRRSKKELKFWLMYFALRYFYSSTDQLRHVSYRSPFLKKLLQIK
jgi:hypothetical protein